jgi:hypothetical protein
VSLLANRGEHAQCLEVVKGVLGKVLHWAALEAFWAKAEQAHFSFIRRCFGLWRTPSDRPALNLRRLF